jgi:hypothetical protein
VIMRAGQPETIGNIRAVSRLAERAFSAPPRHTARISPLAAANYLSDRRKYEREMT